VGKLIGEQGIKYPKAAQGSKLPQRPKKLFATHLAQIFKIINVIIIWSVFLVYSYKKILSHYAKGFFYMKNAGAK
jgi:hypothetical protein